MATRKQREAARENIEKAQEKWESMSSREHARSQPEGRDRAEPGTRGEGDYYRVVVRPKEEFTTFRYHDVGEHGGIQRLAGKRTSGSWDDHAWLIAKDRARIDGDTLVAGDAEAREILDMIGPVKRVKADVFQGRPRENVPEPEKEKPTPDQTRARPENIQKAQEGRQQRKRAS